MTSTGKYYCAITGAEKGRDSVNLPSRLQLLAIPPSDR